MKISNESIKNLFNFYVESFKDILYNRRIQGFTICRDHHTDCLYLNKEGSDLLIYIDPFYDKDHSDVFVNYVTIQKNADVLYTEEYLFECSYIISNDFEQYIKLANRILTENYELITTNL